MQLLEKGHFFGETNKRITFEGLIITDTEYTQEKVDWHYHQNPYFTFILQGHVLEGNHKEIYHCSAGDLLFHNWDDAHYNTKPSGFTRGFHIEFEQQWLNQWNLNTDNLQGSFAIKNPEIKLIFYKLFKESLHHENASRLAIESMLLASLENLKFHDSTFKDSVPTWINPLREFLHEEDTENISLSYLSELFGIHPVHLSRYFPKFFGCSLGEYLRKLKVEKSLSLLPLQNKSLVEIALESGFTDQSHFNRCFKESIGLTPSVYRKHIFS